MQRKTGHLIKALRDITFVLRTRRDEIDAKADELQLDIEDPSKKLTVEEFLLHECQGFLHLMDEYGMLEETDLRGRMIED